MIRVTIELVPYGQEALARTISEVCIANTGDSTTDTADYAAAGYIIKSDNRITEFSTELKSFTRNDGALELVRQVLGSQHKPIDEIKHATRLIWNTRLLNTTEAPNDFE